MVFYLDLSGHLVVISVLFFDVLEAQLALRAFTPAVEFVIRSYSAVMVGTSGNLSYLSWEFISDLYGKVLLKRPSVAYLTPLGVSKPKYSAFASLLIYAKSLSMAEA